MTNEEFIRFAKEHILEYMPEEYADAEVHTGPVVLPNDEQYTGLYVTSDNRTMGNRVWLEEYFGEIRNGRPLEDVMQEIAGVLASPVASLEMNLGDFLDFDSMKSHLTTKLCDPASSSNYLNDKPWVPIGDWGMLFRVKLLNVPGMTGSVPVTYHLMDTWGIDLETLRREAVRNESSLDPAWMRPIQDSVLSGSRVTGPNLLDSETPLRLDPHSLYVLSNKSHFNGACVVGWDGVLERVGEVLGTDFVVVPSSIHEVIIVPDMPGRDMRMTEASLREGNANPLVVAREDILSDRVQFYDRARKQLCSLAEHEAN